MREIIAYGLIAIASGALLERELERQKENSAAFAIIRPVVILLSVQEYSKDKIPIELRGSAVHIVHLQTVIVLSATNITT